MRKIGVILLFVFLAGCSKKPFLFENRTDLGPTENLTIVRDMEPKKFLLEHVGKAYIGFVGGPSLLGRGIRKAEAELTPDGKPSLWSHVWLYEGKRLDGRQWISESTIEFKFWPLQYRNGTQENLLREYFKSMEKGVYFGVAEWSLEQEQKKAIIGEGLKLVGDEKSYPIAGLFRTLYVYVFKPSDYKEWSKGNYYCSAFVQKAYKKGAGIDFDPEMPTKLTSPEHVFQAALRFEGVKVWILVNDDVPLKRRILSKLGKTEWSDIMER